MSGKIFPAWSRKMVGVRNCVEIRMKWGLLVEESRNRHNEFFSWLDDPLDFFVKWASISCPI